MVFSCAPNFRAKAAAKKQALKQKLAGAGAYHGVSLRLLLVDKQVDAQDVLPHAALGCVHVVKYDAHSTTLAELVALIREAHRQNTAPFLSMAIAQHGADEHGQWAWTSDLTVDLKNMHGAIDQLAPIVEVLAAALSKTTAGKAHIDLLACNLATTCKGLIPALEKMYGIDFRASTDETGNDLSGGDWKMETDNDYDVAADYLDAAKLKAYTETMARGGKALAMGIASGMRRTIKGAGNALHLRKRGDKTQGLLGHRDDTMDDPEHGTTEFVAEASASRTRSGGVMTLQAKGTFSATFAAGVEASGDGYDFSAEFLAQAVAKAEAYGNFSYKGADATAQLQLLLQMDATATAKIDTSIGSATAVAKAQAAIEAFAKAEAHLGKNGAMISLGAHIGASVKASGSFKYESHSGALTIEACAAVEVGVKLGGSLEFGITRKDGAVTFGGEVALTAGAGASIYLKVTVDVGKLKAHVYKQVNKHVTQVVVKIRTEVDKRKPEQRQQLLAPGSARATSVPSYTVEFEAEDVEVLALAAAAKAVC